MVRQVFYVAIVALQIFSLIGANPIAQQEDSNTQPLTGKMLTGNMGIGQSPYGFQQFPTHMGGMQQFPFNPNQMGGAGGYNPGYGGFPVGGHGMHPSIGGSGYIPNYLQQYDMLYSKSRKLQ